MAALAPTPPSRIIRVYCPTHKVGFSAAAASVVQCSSHKHTFSTNFLSDGFWEYCCDCQHYWPLDAAKGNIAADECPACERELVRCFVCEDCHVVSVESDNPGRRKEFSISAEGVLKPACPGCLNKPRATKVRHECADFGRDFITTRATCPFCGDPLDPEPQFPCSSSTIRSNIRRELPTLQFDAQSNLLTASPTGPFLLLESSQSRLPLIVPNSPRLSSKQDYYNLYYELFNCDNPGAGEVVILSPATVEKTENGWVLREPGTIEIKLEQTASSESQPPVCEKCGTQGAPSHTFCKRCGSPLKRPQPVESDPSEVTVEPFLNPIAETHDYSPPTTQTVGPTYPWKAIFGVVGGLATLGIILAVIASSALSGNPVEKKLDKAIMQGNLFGPGSDCVRALYLELQNSGASEQKLRPYRERILPLLTDHPLQMFTEFMVPGSDEVPLNEWQDAARSLGWAAELKPDDKSLRARSLYADGRIAYLLKNENLAISTWTRAGEADAAWPLPINGIGLIYTGRKDYATARRYYQAAIQRDPNWAYPYNNMGTAYFMEKNYYEAKGFYQKAANLAPRWARPHSWLGDIAMKEGDYNTAINEFTMTLDANATGTKNMNLDKIREQLALAQQKAASSSF